ncbi:MAG: hypothetical protein NC184_02330 [Roseburia sp.]|nr:hypothetical protein [Roseburia sp.]
MSLLLSDDEKILKSYEYSKTIGKKSLFKPEQVSSKLIVTNKRIIDEHSSDKGVSRSEIPVDSADYIGTYFTKKMPSLILGIVLIVLGVIASIVAAIVLMPLIAVGILLVVIGVVLIVKAILGRGGSVVVQISGYHGDHNLMSLGSSMGVFASGVKNIKVAVNVEIAEQMVNEIGAIIMNVKSAAAK